MIKEVKKNMFVPQIGQNEEENRLYEKRAYASTLADMVGGYLIESYYDVNSVKNLDKKIRVLESIYKKEKTMKELGGELIDILELYPKNDGGEEVEIIW